MRPSVHSLSTRPSVSPHTCCVVQQVPCRGKGQSPDTTAVNTAVYEIWAFLEHFPDKYVFVHCTHGFNRTGRSAQPAEGRKPCRNLLL